MRKNLAIVFLSLTLLVPGVSHAVRDYGRSGLELTTDVYLTVKYGIFTLAIDVPEDGSDVGNLGFVFGKGINDYLALEFEYNYNVVEDKNYLGDDAGLSMDAIGLFLAAKTMGDVYVKGRLGYMRVAHDFGASTLTTTYSQLEGTKNIYGLAFGVGAGLKVAKGHTLELEYTLYPEREDVTLDFTSSGGPIINTDLESDFLSFNYVASFD